MVSSIEDGQANAASDMQFVFVGAVVPRNEAEGYPGYSVAGNLWQIRLLTALRRNGFLCTRVVSVRPVPSFPHLKKAWFSSSETKFPDGLVINYLQFINIGPIKTLSLGLANVTSLLTWGWRCRHAKNKAIISYNVSAPQGLTTLLAARIVRTKAFAIIADLPVPGHGIISSTILRRLEFHLQSISLPHFDGLIVLTRDIAVDFASQVPFMVMEGAVDRSAMESVTYQLPSENNNAFTLMYAGALNAFDGIPLLLEAFSRLREDSYRLLIAGRGPLEMCVQQAATKDPRITFLGFLSHEEVVAHYQRADLLVNPRPSAPLSTRYVFPSKLIEYLATGKPVMSTATAGVMEEYGDHLFVLRNETPQGLADLVSQIAALPPEIRHAIGSQARAFTLSHKSWEAQGKRIADFVREHVCS